MQKEQEMRPVIRTSDHAAIKAALANLPYKMRTVEASELAAEIEKAEIVPDDEIGDDIIRLNSYFEVQEAASGNIYRFTLTLPSHADIKEKRISILTPMGVALIGFREGLQINWKLPGGEKKLKILAVRKPEFQKSGV